jgi:hypothetical protein
LKFSVHPALDWCETEYTAARLLEIAAAVRMHPHPIEARTAEGLTSFWNLAIEQVLRALAGSPAALKALNHRQRTPPARIVGLNRAVHFHVQAEMHHDWKKAAIHADVAEAWGVASAQIKADVRKYALANDAKALAVDGLYDAKRLMLMIVHNACNTSRRPRAKVLRDFDADLRDRGATEK